MYIMQKEWDYYNMQANMMMDYSLGKQSET